MPLIYSLHYNFHYTWSINRLPHSNFPETVVPLRDENTVRFTVVNKNNPGVLALILDEFAKANMNIGEMINQSRGSIAYNVLDIENSGDSNVMNFKTVQEKITMLDDVLSSRLIYGEPGTGFAKNIGGEYFV